MEQVLACKHSQETDNWITLLKTRDMTFQSDRFAKIFCIIPRVANAIFLSPEEVVELRNELDNFIYVNSINE